jgi:hypothetical protein
MQRKQPLYEIKITITQKLSRIWEEEFQWPLAEFPILKSADFIKEN